MANKFTKSILERQEKEEKMTPDQPAQINNDEQDTPFFTSQITSDLSKILAAEPTRHAKNKTYYLDEDVIQAVKKAASNQNTTESRLINQLLKNLFPRKNNME